MQETLTKAHQSMQLVIGDLKVALAKANHLEAILLLDAMEQAAKLSQRISAIAYAVENSRE